MMNFLHNEPALWLNNLPKQSPEDHKYNRGMAVIYGAPKMTGATRLAAMACARIGAGYVKVIAPEGAGDIYRKTLPAHLVIEDEGVNTDISDPRIKALLVGPGWSKDDALAHMNIFKKLTIPVVLDAGAFLALGEWDLPRDNLVVTPHEGEFTTLFPDITGEKKDRAEEAARRIGGVVVLKGPETIITDGGHSVSNNIDAPQLATAGTGDVLAGMITGLIAQGMPPMEASCAAVWIHGEAARRFGKGLVASDLPDLIPAVLQDLQR